MHYPELLRDAEYLLTAGGTSLIHHSKTFHESDSENAPCWIRVTAAGSGGRGSVPIISQ